ncbi:MAG TPA: 1-deoxy-D-xylulose-5-phosphate reductoisomerase [Gammaproteobacteria bacterium]|nr:1-deoxy-D-xylulose-5-phosphate reductoisomerase [Gammaproteobacteria bacterium]
MKNITILGATGSIGSSTLSVISRHPQKFSVFAMSANTNWRSMAELCNKFEPRFAVMSDSVSASKLKHALEIDTIVMSGSEALCEIASHHETDYVMAAIVGSTGMPSALAAANAGKRVMLANKESLVLAGEIFIGAIKKSGAELIPVDSEHSAIFQCLNGDTLSNEKGVATTDEVYSSVVKVQLTASGGPFFRKPIDEFMSITPEQACAHPNWSMGKKISVDSATMMNKGLEAIEAHYLFALHPDQIDIVIHPQSIIHSSVYFKDGSTLSQLGSPDMRTAVSYALSYPTRIESGVSPVDLTKQSLDFYIPDNKRFPCLGLAIDALKMGGCCMGTINAANEIAVSSFLENKIKFLDIHKVIEQTLSLVPFSKNESLAQVMSNDELAREVASEVARSYA